MYCRGLSSLLPTVVALLLWCVTPVGASLSELDSDRWTQHADTQPPPDLLVLLYRDSGGDSQQAEQLLEGMVQEGEIEQVLPGIQVMKQKEGGPLAEELGLKTLPAVLLIRDGITAYYTGSLEESSDLYMWLDRAGRTAVTRELGDQSFEHLTQASTGSTTGHWLVLFYRPQCQDHFSVLETVGISEKLWMNVARVNLDLNPQLEKRFKITACPELVYFRQGKMYQFEMRKFDVPSITNFVTSWFRNVKAAPVPLMPTAFDELTEGIARYIKTHLEGENRTFSLIVIAGLVLTIIITVVFCCVTGGSDSKHKTD